MGLKPFSDQTVNVHSLVMLEKISMVRIHLIHFKTTLPGSLILDPFDVLPF